MVVRARASPSSGRISSSILLPPLPPRCATRARAPSTPPATPSPSKSPFRFRTSITAILGLRCRISPTPSHPSDSLSARLLPLSSSFLRRRPSSDRPSRPLTRPIPRPRLSVPSLRPFCPRLSSSPPPSPLLPGSSCPFLVISSPSPRLLGNNLPRVLRAVPLCRHSSPARPPACRPPPRRPAPLRPPSLALAVATRCAVIQWASGPDATLFCQPFRTPSSWGSHSIYVCRPDTVLVPVISLQLE